MVSSPRNVEGTHSTRGFQDGTLYVNSPSTNFAAPPRTSSLPAPILNSVRTTSDLSNSIDTGSWRKGPRGPSSISQADRKARAASAQASPQQRLNIGSPFRTSKFTTFKRALFPAGGGPRSGPG